jgi:hypothetical protein
MTQVRIKIGQENCLNDVPVYTEKTLPEITALIDKHFKNGNWGEMVKAVERLKRVVKDLDDMSHELLGD